MVFKDMDMKIQVERCGVGSCDVLGGETGWKVYKILLLDKEFYLINNSLFN